MGGDTPRLFGGWVVCVGAPMYNINKKNKKIEIGKGWGCAERHVERVRDMGENEYMRREEHVGVEWSESFYAGREKRRVFRYVNKETGEQVKGVGSFIGRLLEAGSGCEVGGLRCGWLENGDIEVVFPAMEAGRYRIVIEHVGQNGEVSRFLHGYAGYLAPEYVFKEVSEREETVVTVCCGDGVHEVYALAGSAVDYSAEEALDAAKRAEDAKKEAREQLDACIAFMASFNEALRATVQVVNDYLWIGGVNTGHYVKGLDGATPEYRSDGYWYINNTRVGKARGDDGITPHITSDGYWAIGSMKTTVRAAGRDGVDGASIRRVLIPSVADLPEQKELGVFYYIKIAEKLYDVYAWLDPDGWVNIKEDSSFATAEDYGIMKYGTDIPVLDGAPLGRSKTGHAYTGYATYYEPGVGKLSSALVVAREESAPVALNEDGQFCVYKATIAFAGSVALSYFGKEALNDLLGGPIGRNENGNIYTAPATEGKWGAVKGGKRYTVTVPEPYVRKTGETPEREMANYALFGGALQTRKAAAWRGTMSWLDEQMQLHSEYFAGEGDYDGLLHSGQFTQSWGNGLELLPATTKLLAGVYLAESMSDTRSAAVVQPAILVNYLSEHYYGKSQVYTKQETLTELQTRLNSYVSLSWAQDNLMSRTEIMDELRKKIGCPSGKIANFDAIPASERGDMSSVDAKTFTIVYAG